MTPPRAIIIDRDATLIDVVRDEETGGISVAFHPNHLRLLPGVIEGLRELIAAGYRLAIATNQPGPAKGQHSKAAVERTNRALLAKLEDEGCSIKVLEVCLHHPTGGPGGDPELIGPCDCRKPQPGMLNSALSRLSVAPAHAWMVGDSMDDLHAARAAGVRAALVFPLNRCQLCPLRDGPEDAPDIARPRFDEVASAILRADELA